jgi:uncharacterized membrane protein YebE (DUF533 family)
MINVDKLLGQILNSGQGKTLAGGLLVGGLAGALSGKTGKKVAKTALKLGGAAAVAGLAYAAYQRYRAGQPQSTVSGAPRPAAPPRTVDQRLAEIEDTIDVPPPGSAYLPPPADTAATEALSLKLIRAMIAAAKADGRVDAAESAKIFGQIDALGLDPDEKAFLLTEIAKPLSARDIAASAACPEQAAELYAVSVMAVNPHGPAERGYLAELARLMNLEPGLAQAIHDRATAA